MAISPHTELIAQEVTSLENIAQDNEVMQKATAENVPQVRKFTKGYLNGIRGSKRSSIPTKIQRIIETISRRRTRNNNYTFLSNTMP